MATRNVTYQFEEYFVTYDRQTEADQVAQVEAANNYIAKFDVNMDERELIDEGKAKLVVDGDELLLQGWMLP